MLFGFQRQHGTKWLKVSGGPDIVWPECACALEGGLWLTDAWDILGLDLANCSSLQTLQVE